ncbi:hypothetical protein M1D69_10980 [Bacillus sp. PK3-037]|uniref:hypothetical protein n=1 Tax=Bacillus halotolerans TaxID=260554 RepID=UPI00192DDEB7|nr:hypothetical protein [Bacillus halotolerans]MBL6010600.1 hypothetical protein [Bacillus halotolerans]UQZ46223.1 hypothetical protein C2H92_05635 [Bacillus halotolerans]
MKKVTILKASILFLAIASFHLFSIPHAFDIGHHYKAVADQQEIHEMKAGQNADDEKKSITGAFALTAFSMAVLLMTAENKDICYSRRRQRRKSFILAKFYQSSYFDKLHVQHHPNI